MSNDSNVKLIAKDATFMRKQIKNVLQEVGRDIVAAEAGAIISKSLEEKLNARLDSIDKYCQEALGKQDARAKAIQSFLVQQVLGKIQQDLFDANVTVEAVVEVLAESGISIENFGDKVNAKKPQIAQRKIELAGATAKAEVEKKNAELKAKEAAESTPSES